LKEVPKRMLILGGGIIGLEMGTVYSTLGARLDVVEMLDGLMQGADRDLVKIWQKMNAKRFDNIMLKTKTVGAKATPAKASRSRLHPRRRAAPPLRRRPTTWCCRPWAARPTARRSPPTRLAWP
jgi:pyruvate/2-oxoglutarate dehydrogenase complex dihydrolipoamide dehydrogenase (E3) component